jgi:hypothetical protein
MAYDEVKQMNNDASVDAIDRLALDRLIRQQGENFSRNITERHVHLFSAVAVFITPQQLSQMEAVIAAVEEVVRLPGWTDKLVPPHSARGVFFGYDFHLNESGAHLIEINTNAGGAFLNALLLRSQLDSSLPGKTTSIINLEQSLVEMFCDEWRLQRGDDAPLGCVAIVDEKPFEQYLYPEFILAQQLFEQAGIRAVIADPAELIVRADGIYLQDQKIDLIYNRLTDFSLDNHPALLESYQKNQVVLTPNPSAYTRYADKRNLVKLTDIAFLRSLNLDARSIDELQNGIPQTRIVNAQDARQWWAERKQWFFKPVTGYGAKGAYRGDKITTRVFDEILAGDYVAQKLAMPGECSAMLDGERVLLKYDVRCYVYDGKVQLVVARLYQGQTTNFRTPGGGFGLVRVV